MAPCAQVRLLDQVFGIENGTEYAIAVGDQLTAIRLGLPDELSGLHHERRSFPCSGLRLTPEVRGEPIRRARAGRSLEGRPEQGLGVALFPAQGVHRTDLRQVEQ